MACHLVIVKSQPTLSFIQQMFVCPLYSAPGPGYTRGAVAVTACSQEDICLWLLSAGFEAA